MKFVKIIAAFVMLAMVTAAFFGVPFCSLACKLQPGPSYWFLGVLALTFAWGRFFCEVMCPLGILQSIVNFVFHPKTHVRRVCSRLPVTKTQKMVRLAVLVAFVGLVAAGVGVAWSISPYAIYGRALAMWLPGLIVFAVVLVLSAIGKGRVWCNWVCPFGTVFTVLSMFSLRKQKVVKCCANCRACFPMSSSPKTEDTGMTRREALQGVAMVAAVDATEKLTDGGYAPISLPGSPVRERSVLPPGAGKRAVFERRCVGCGLCVRNCSGECLVHSSGLKNFGQPEMSFQKGHCIIGCTKCGDVCPAGALERVDKTTKANIHVGFAEWHKDRCIRMTEKVQCNACEKKCPVNAIHMVEGVPVVDRQKCLGCGACEHVCPSRPMPAMAVVGYDEQVVVRPMSESDLIAEMVARVHAGKAIVVARNGVISAAEEGRGVKPILDLLDRGELKGAIVVDKIIGRAAASACVVGGAKRVFSVVMSKGAQAFLKEHGIAADAETLTDEIVNRAKTGMCPMEQRVLNETDPEKMVELIRKPIK